MEFHLSRKARYKYQFDQSIAALSGNVIFANFHAARLFAQKINERRDLVHFPEQAVHAGSINAMGLIDEIMHLVILLYRQQKNPSLTQDALDWLFGLFGKEEIDAALREFADEFPPLAVYSQDSSVDEYLNDDTDGVPNRQVLLEEMILLWLSNTNPAYAPYRELFDDSRLDAETAYHRIIPSLHAFFETLPTFGPEEQNLLDMLRSPAIASPHSIPGQLEYIRQRWGYLLGRYLYRLLGSLDLIREEEKAIFFGPGPSRVYDFRGLELESERFSPDKDWMPRLVLIAKNTYVWLDQLSKKYQRAITQLDHIPNEELDTLAKWGFTGLWLIGLWERSPASRKIKQYRGNPEAVSSAYSIFEYQIASELGGEVAFQNLRERAWSRGIRLASDMVPNHMGIDSRWVIEHPDWFIGLDYSPFPSYTFNSGNLSDDNRAGIHIEDHYYNNTDAAVAFKRVDYRDGSTRYIYHGNDGTSMPWNDTAQLNYLIPEVREAVIQTILDVARKFPVIRFDAAMTLAKKHYQRLWFPQPGSGGDIPSRADHGLTKEQFDALMPEEFWRQVVDRVAQEVPDTLLLAEAFWLMEGYFVRTLGMHRVYNSAFMNMLRDEKNAEYRLVIKNTLEFDPEILKRYVNFMNNPDERTAVDQFEKGDKYFGICTLMATMPGLPMFGHGQIEGFTEKYGMEYKRSYWEETPDSYLVNRHIQQIFPLLRRRYLFAEVRDFLLYDFFSTDGYVNEDVFAYSNRLGDERALVIYHNRYSTARGWIKSSAAFSVKTSASGDRKLIQSNLGEGLGVPNDENIYCIFRDSITGLEYLRNNREIAEKGLYIELDAYKCHVFMDFRQVIDNEWHQYAQMSSYLDGRGVPSVEEAMKEVFLQPIHFPFRELVNAGMYQWIIDNRVTDPASHPLNQEVLDQSEEKMARLLREVKHQVNGSGDEAKIAQDIRCRLGNLLILPSFESQYPLAESKEYLEAIQYLLNGLRSHPVLSEGDIYVWGVLLSWLFTHGLGEVLFDTNRRDPSGKESDSAEITRSWIDEWLLGKITVQVMQDLGCDEASAWKAVEATKLMIKYQDWIHQDGPEEIPVHYLETWLKDSEIQQYIGINRHQGILWYNKESFDEFLWWMYLAGILYLLEPDRDSRTDIPGKILRVFQVIDTLRQAEERSGYQVEKLMEAATETETI